MRRHLAVCLALSAAAHVATAQSKLAPELTETTAGTTIDVIVQYRDTPALHHQRVLDRGGRLKTELGVIRAAHYALPASEIEALANDPDIEYISPDHVVTSTSTNLYTGSPDHGWQSVGADLATNVFGLDGTGVGIALIDSGVDSLTDLRDAFGRDRVVYRGTFLPNSTATDSYGHGDHVAGIMAGNGAQSSGSSFTYEVRGIAPNAHIVSLKALDSNGAGTDSSVIAAIQQAILLKTRYNIRIINLSVGRPVTTSYLRDPLCLAVQQAWRAGIVVVVAAGNEGRNNSLGTNGYGTIAAPGNSPYVITVGAMNTVGTATTVDDKIASYSSKGPSSIDHIVKPDLVAPGNRILSLSQGKGWFARTYAGNQVAAANISHTNSNGPSAYYVMSGTSMAAPMVSGAAALMLQKEPWLTPDQVKARLMKTATKFVSGISTATDPLTGVTYTDEFDIFTVGAGYLNIPEALANNDLLIGTALSPVATFDALTETVSIDGASVIWGTNVSWGTRTRSLNAIWGTMAIWGTGTDATEAASLAVNGDK